MPAMSLAGAMRPADPPGADSQVNRDLLRVMEGISPGYLLLLAATVLSVVAAGGVWIWQVYLGLGVGGYAHPIFWGVYIVTFVFLHNL